MLVIASPQVDVSEVEAKKIKAYLEAGVIYFGCLMTTIIAA